MTHVKKLICELGKQFYDLGWVSGTGGGISIKQGNLVYIAPSGVQKERLDPTDIFVLDEEGAVLEEGNGKVSACTPLFYEIFKRKEAGAVIHNHSVYAARASLAFNKRFKITGIEMAKGIEGYDVFDTLTVPIIENVSHEKDLAKSLGKILEENPTPTSAVLVRGHGVYCPLRCMYCFGSLFFTICCSIFWFTSKLLLSWLPCSI